MKNMRSHLALVSLLVMFAGAGALVQDEDTAFTPSIWGIEMPVTDVDRAVSYYTEVLGFKVVQSPGSQRRVVLDNDGLKLIFRLTENIARPDDAAQLNLNLRVANLDQAARSVRETGGSLESSEPIIAAIGKFIPTLDPFGNSVHLIDLNGEENDPDGLPRLYNVGFTILDMDTTEAFYTSLGFEVYSRDYLPDTLPLKPVGASMLVLHP
ncbi:MAG: VOC family protein, partial [Planctomycetes bacterium]|nr:VOC family protein [Planctomycetota bacterium]